MAFSGILAALYLREESGRGQHIEASMFAGLTPLDYFSTTHFQLAARANATRSATEAAASPGGLFAASRYSLYLLTKDNQWVVVAVQQAQNAKALMSAMGLERTYDDPRFANAPVFQSAEDAQAWETILWEAFRERTWGELEPLLFAELRHALRAGGSERAWTRPSPDASQWPCRLGTLTLSSALCARSVPSRPWIDPLTYHAIRTFTRVSMAPYLRPETSIFAEAPHQGAPLVRRDNRRVRLLLRDALRCVPRLFPWRTRHQAGRSLTAIRFGVPLGGTQGARR